MKILNYFNNNPADYLFSLLKIANYNDPRNSLRFWFNHCKEKADTISGDIFEFSVFQGTSLISKALLLKSINSVRVLEIANKYNLKVIEDYA